MSYDVAFHLAVTIDNVVDAAAALEAHLMDVADQLADLEDADPRVHDVDLGATLTTGEVTVTMIVDADPVDEALAVAAGLLRSGIHAAGGFTPGWDHPGPGKFRVDLREATQRPLTSTS